MSSPENFDSERAFHTYFLFSFTSICLKNENTNVYNFLQQMESKSENMESNDTTVFYTESLRTQAILLIKGIKNPS